MYRLGRYTEALTNIEAELRLRNHPEAYFYQALVYRGLSDATAERSALENLLLANIKGRITYQLDAVSPRVLQITEGDAGNRRLRTIFDQLYALFPTERSVVSTLAEIHNRLGEQAKAAELMQRFPAATTR